MRPEGNFPDAAFSGPAISYTLGRLAVNMPGAIVSGDGAFARRLYRRTPEQADCLFSTEQTATEARRLWRP